MSKKFMNLAHHRIKEGGPWQCEGWVPRAGIMLIEGDPATNKTTATLNLAAQITTAGAFCSAKVQSPGGVLILQAEDSTDRLVRNLKAGGADLDRVLALEATDRFVLPDSIDEIRDAAESVDARLIIFDPASAYIGGSTNAEQTIRKALSPLLDLVKERHATGVLIRHLTKSGGNHPMYRGIGSIGFMALARLCVLVAIDPTDPQRRIIAQSKNSLGPIQKSLVFRPVEQNGGLTVEWLGESKMTAADLLSVSDPHERPALRQAVEVLFSLLVEGPALAKKIEQGAAACGVAPRTLRRAKQVLGVRWSREGFGVGSRIWWSLPSDTELVQRLRAEQLNDLCEQLFHGESVGPDFSDSSPIAETDAWKVDTDTPSQWRKDDDDKGPEQGTVA